MAVKIGSDDDELAESHEINITPFIDVMLVLLIIFMIAAPLSTVDIPVELPVAVADPPKRPSKPVFVTISEELEISVGETKTTLERLPTDIHIATQIDREMRIYIRADKSVPYGEFMRVMNILRGDGYLKVGLVGLDDNMLPQDPGNTKPGSQSSPVETDRNSDRGIE